MKELICGSTARVGWCEGCKHFIDNNTKEAHLQGCARGVYEIRCISLPIPSHGACTTTVTYIIIITSCILCVVEQARRAGNDPDSIAKRRREHDMLAGRPNMDAHDCIRVMTGTMQAPEEDMARRLQLAEECKRGTRDHAYAARDMLREVKKRTVDREICAVCDKYFPGGTLRQVYPDDHRLEVLRTRPPGEDPLVSHVVPRGAPGGVGFALSYEYHDKDMLQACKSCLSALDKGKVPEFSVRHKDLGPPIHVLDLPELTAYEELLVSSLYTIKYTMIIRDYVRGNRTVLKGHMLSMWKSTQEEVLQGVRRYLPASIADVGETFNIVFVSPRSREAALEQAKRFTPLMVRGAVVVRWCEHLVRVYGIIRERRQRSRVPLGSSPLDQEVVLNPENMQALLDVDATPHVSDAVAGSMVIQSGPEGAAALRVAENHAHDSYHDNTRHTRMADDGDENEAMPDVDAEGEGSGENVERGADNEGTEDGGSTSSGNGGVGAGLETVDAEPTCMLDTSLVYEPQDISEQQRLRHAGAAMEYYQQPWQQRDPRTALVLAHSGNPYSDYCEDFFVLAFPSRFPNGVGGRLMDDQNQFLQDNARERKIPTDTYIRMLAYRASFKPQAIHLAGMSNVKMRQATSLSSFVSFKNNPADFNTISNANEDDFKRLAQVLRSGGRPSAQHDSPAVNAMHRQVVATSTRVCGSPYAKRPFRLDVFAGWHLYGYAAVFYTFNPAEMVNPFSLWICGHEVTLSEMEREDIGFPGWEERVKMCVDNPKACGNFFEIVVDCFHEIFLGFTKANGGVQMLDDNGRPKGFFGPIYAHANSVEQNGRDMNHLHGSFIPQILKLHDFEEMMKDGQKRVLSWMGSLATACLPYEIQRLGEGGEGQAPIDVDVDAYELLEESAGYVSMEDVYKAKHSAHSEGDPSPTAGVHIAGLANMPRECRETYPEDEGLRRLDTECDSESLLYRLYDEVDNAVREYESAEDKSDGGAADEKLCREINRLHTWVACQRSTVFHKHTATCKKNGCKGDDTDCCRGFGPTAERVLHAKYDGESQSFHTPRNMPKMVITVAVRLAVDCCLPAANFNSRAYIIRSCIVSRCCLEHTAPTTPYTSEGIGVREVRRRTRRPRPRDWRLVTAATITSSTCVSARIICRVTLFS